MELGERVKKLRTDKNWTQAELGLRLGISAQAVSKWENNIATPDVWLLIPLARLFDTTVDALLSSDEQQQVTQPLNEKLQASDSPDPTPSEQPQTMTAPLLPVPVVTAVSSIQRQCPDCFQDYGDQERHCHDCHQNYPAHMLHCTDCHQNHPADLRHCADCHQNYLKDELHCEDCHQNYQVDEDHCPDCHQSYPKGSQHCPDCHLPYDGPECPFCSGFVDEDDSEDEVHTFETHKGIHIRVGRHGIFIRRERERTEQQD